MLTLARSMVVNNNVVKKLFRENVLDINIFYLERIYYFLRYCNEITIFLQEEGGGGALQAYVSMRGVCSYAHFCLDE